MPTTYLMHHLTLNAIHPLNETLLSHATTLLPLRVKRGDAWEWGRCSQLLTNKCLAVQILTFHVGDKNLIK